MHQRESFSSRMGFVLACVGAAVGLGNLWMFPWRLSQYGGAAFFFFWVYGVDKAKQEINVGAKYPLGRWWNPLAKYVFVGVAVLVVILQVLFRIG